MDWVVQKPDSNVIRMSMGKRHINQKFEEKVREPEQDPEIQSETNAQKVFRIPELRKEIFKYFREPWESKMKRMRVNFSDVDHKFGSEYRATRMSTGGRRPPRQLQGRPRQ